MKETIAGGGIWPCIVTVVGLLALSGCGTTQNPEAGKIYVDRPEVFTRERLINRRLAEQRWLENQLGKDAEFTLQGYRDVREFTGFALALKGQFDPLGGAQAESLLADVKGNSRIGELQDELQVEVLRKQLEQVRSSTNVFPLMPGQITATNPPALPTNVTNPLPAAAATINLNTFATTNLPALPNPTNRYKSTAQLTSIQTLDDKLAYRNAIQARLREQELDDTHDLQGMTLYTLKFDITVAPGENNPSLGELRLGMTGLTGELSGEDFTNWVAALNRELRDESVGLQRRYLMRFLTDDEKMQLMSLALKPRSEAANILEKENPRQLEFGFVKALANSTNLSAVAQYRSLGGLLSELNSGKPGTNGCQGLAFIVQSRYQQALAGLVSLPPPTNGVAMESNVFFLVTANAAGSKSFTNFINEMKSVRNTATPYVYTVEPKEYAQNISDVAAREKLVSYSLALSAAIPQAGASVGANMEYMRRSQTLLEAIKRRPLVVGFADGTTNFGWVVGPKFEIEDAKVRFSHTHVQHSVQATVVVPAWWHSLTLNQSFRWLQKNGDPYPTKPGQDVSIALPRDYAAITRALLARLDQSLNKPSILPRWNADVGNGRQKITLQEGTDETLLIRGRDLWRNPEVYIGGQQALDVRVLPDMAGLRADFKSIRFPAVEKREPQLVDLTVVTSAGSTVLRDGVRILPSGGTRSEIEKFAQLKNSFVVLSSNLVFTIDAKLLPQSYGELVLKVSDKNQELTVPNSLPGANPPQSPEWQVPFMGKYLEKFPTQASQEIWIDLGLRSKPDPKQALVPVLTDAPRPLVFFTNVTESRFNLETNVVVVPLSGSDAQIKLGLMTAPELFIKAWPGLVDSITSGTAKLSGDRDGTNTFNFSVHQPAPVTFKPLTVTVKPEQVSALKADSTNAFTLKLLVGQLEVPVTGNITIIRPKP